MNLEVKLNEVCNINMGQSPDSSTYNSERAGLPFFQGNADFGEISPISRVWCCHPIKIAEKGDILISVRAPIGAMNIADNKCCIGRGLAAIRIIEKEKCDADYLFYYLESKIPYLQSRGTGSTFKAINKNVLKELIVNLPELGEQRFIATQVTKIKSAIKFKKQQLAEYEKLVKSQFIEMFGNGNYAEGAICELVDQNITSARKRYSDGDKIRYIDISSIDNKMNVMTGYTEYLFSDAPSRAQHCLKENDIVISTVRPNLRNIAMNGFNYDNLVASSGFCILRAKNCNAKYLFNAVLQDAFSRKMSELTTGANYPAIKDADVLSYRIPVPPLERQNEFARFVEQTDKSKIHFQMEVAA